jgi:hypothetical protein
MILRMNSTYWGRFTNLSVFVKEKMFSMGKELNILILYGGTSGFRGLY